ncbi:hypothetical protein CONPUDRAFT_82823 [Coniophora puteana RWD-64-598 SS2]|uniref:Uncharacterized protein n=1 Tax=Coniophora puteana (strain RWD-64-598) TaxID=741705 RepID=A0A5M3MNJ8_CONPW|nr:uncharacterized protein CONPUDRAFT_82823 [Coniophora puteana RWD-64-598 SS2]EIW80732.1 hypothetical protein CONPUDRAFT_82823 [Coniophora puteana RWD-64-598 SS2]
MHLSMYGSFVNARTDVVKREETLSSLTFPPRSVSAGLMAPRIQHHPIHIDADQQC